MVVGFAFQWRMVGNMQEVLSTDLRLTPWLTACTHRDENKCAALWAFLPLDPTANTAETVALDLL